MRRTVLVIALALLASPALADTLHYGERLSVYDGAGKRVGHVWPGLGVLAGGPTQHIGLRARDGRTFVVYVYPGALTGTSFLYFRTTDCRGQAFVEAQLFEISLQAAIVAPGQTVYVESGGRARRWMYSFRNPSGECIELDFQPGVYGWFAPATAEIDLADHFTPPYRLGAARGELVEPGDGP